MCFATLTGWYGGIKRTVFDPVVIKKQIYMSAEENGEMVDITEVPGTVYKKIQS